MSEQQSLDSNGVPRKVARVNRDGTATITLPSPPTNLTSVQHEQPTSSVPAVNNTAANHSMLNAVNRVQPNLSQTNRVHEIPGSTSLNMNHRQFTQTTVPTTTTNQGQQQHGQILFASSSNTEATNRPTPNRQNLVDNRILPNNARNTSIKKESLDFLTPYSVAVTMNLLTQRQGYPDCFRNVAPLEVKFGHYYLVKLAGSQDVFRCQVFRYHNDTLDYDIFLNDVGEFQRVTVDKIFVIDQDLAKNLGPAVMICARVPLCSCLTCFLMHVDF